MAEENPMSPISAAEPPKADPLAKPVSAHAATLKLKPVIRKPGADGATQTGLKPGLKLPTKPALSTAGLKLPPKPTLSTAGLKLPPKPGGTVTGLKPGVRLPPKPGLAAKGMKLPTQTGLRPAIRPPAALSAATPDEKPAAKPEATPVSAAPNPPEATKPLEALKAVTQNLKNITAPIPQQAILHKTGIIADPELSAPAAPAAAAAAPNAELTDAQKQAAKSKTSRISLSDAMGAAPVSNDAPMKTIRIKRPVGLPSAPPAAPKPAEVSDAASAPVPSLSAATTVATPAQPGPSITQRKTLKISRPSGVVRPAGKFGVTKTAATAAAPAPAAGDEVADIPDIPNLPPVAPVAASANGEAAVTGAFAIVSLIAQVAACIAIGALAWLLYVDTTTPMF